jgi:inhibitor of cysteine peptidase
VEDRLAASPTRPGLAVAIVVMIAELLAACGGADDGPILTEERIGSEVEVEAGAQFEVRLESNPSTGYAWEVSAMTTPDLVTLDRRTHVGPDTDLVGAAGTDVFVFTAGAGAGILRLEYVRSFDDPGIPERVAEFIIRIDGAELPPPPGTTPPTATAVAPDVTG